LSLTVAISQNYYEDSMIIGPLLTTLPVS
jgi:hypothetical protein